MKKPGQEIGKVLYSEGTSLTFLKLQKTRESYKFEGEKTNCILYTKYYRLHSVSSVNTVPVP